MFNVGPGEMLAICLLALIVLGPERLPQAMGQVGRFVGQMRKLSGGFQDEIKRAMDPLNAPFRPGEEVLHGPVADSGTPAEKVAPIDEVKVVADEIVPDEIPVADESPTGNDQPVEPVVLAKSEEAVTAIDSAYDETTDESMPPAADVDPGSDMSPPESPFDAIAPPPETDRREP